MITHFGPMEFTGVSTCQTTLTIVQITIQIQNNYGDKTFLFYFALIVIFYVKITMVEYEGCHVWYILFTGAIRKMYVATG